MSDPTEPAAAGKRAFSPIRLTITVAIVAAIGAVTYFTVLAQIKGSSEVNEAERTRKAMGLGEPVTNQLDKTYSDNNDDLVADAPKDPADQLDPSELTFSFIATDDPSVYAAQWEPFMQHLSQATGKTVKYVPYTSRNEQLRAIRDGELHIAGLNTGSVPIAVNSCGFIPLCAPGKTDQATAYKMVVIVPAGSKIKKLSDLRGERFAFTQPTSNSGCKAAIVILSEGGLTLGEDYEAVFTHSHAQLMSDIAAKKYVAGSTASDLLERAIEQGEIEQNAVEIIHKSPAFPSAAIGMTHKLKPELGEKLSAAMRSFVFTGTPLEKEYAPSGADRLVPINYKDDFAMIRRIDNEVGFDHRRALDTESADDESSEDEAE